MLEPRHGSAAREALEAAGARAGGQSATARGGWHLMGQREDGPGPATFGGRRRGGDATSAPIYVGGSTAQHDGDLTAAVKPDLDDPGGWLLYSRDGISEGVVKLAARRNPNGVRAR